MALLISIIKAFIQMNIKVCNQKFDLWIILHILCDKLHHMLDTGHQTME